MYAVARTYILSMSLVYHVTSTNNNVQGIERNLELGKQTITDLLR